MLHGVFLVKLEGLYVLDKPLHIAHAKQLTYKRLWGETLKIEHVLAGANEDDGGVSCCNRGDGTTA